ncbi:hypothetical protein GCM10020255_093470 [Rhodococcus baikonurensis]
MTSIASPTATRTAATVKARKAALGSFVGTAIEWYDFFIYGTAAALVLGKQFFPGTSDLAAPWPPSPPSPSDSSRDPSAES